MNELFYVSSSYPSGGLIHEDTDTQSSDLKKDTGTQLLDLKENIDKLMATTQHYLKKVRVIDVFNTWSLSTGAYVQLRQEFAYCPVLMGNDNRPVFLYEFVEAIDGLLDYNRIREELPTISSAQIDGAISFLRRLTQFNINDLDIDELSDEELAQDENLLRQLRTGLNDRETAHVLNFDDSDR